MYTEDIDLIKDTIVTNEWFLNIFEHEKHKIEDMIKNI